MIADFGVSRILSQDFSLSMTQERFVGTPSYMSPELWDGKSISKSADIYAFGCIIYEMLTGKKLFSGNSIVQIMQAHLKGPQFQSHWETDIPPDLPRILKTALASDPESRFPTTSAFWHALKNTDDERPECKSISNINSTNEIELFEDVDTYTEGVKKNKTAQHIPSKKGVIRHINNRKHIWYGVSILLLSDAAHEIATALTNTGYKITSKQDTGDLVIITAEHKPYPLIPFHNKVLIELQRSTLVYETDIIITTMPAMNIFRQTPITIDTELILTEIEKILK
jgi:serine/threonine protein kinase